MHALAQPSRPNARKLTLVEEACFPLIALRAAIVIVRRGTDGDGRILIVAHCVGYPTEDACLQA